jgi:membrane protein implicated in regulation of membrane protease activity
MRANFGSYLLAIVAIVTGIFTVAFHWPWPWWAFAIIVVLTLIGGVFMLRDKRKKDGAASDGTAFIEGSPQLVDAEDVFTTGKNFIRGDPGIVFLKRIIHMPGYRNGEK